MEDTDKKYDGEQRVETWVDLVSLVNKIDSLQSVCVRYQRMCRVYPLLLSTYHTKGKQSRRSCKEMRGEKIRSGYHGRKRGEYGS